MREHKQQIAWAFKRAMRFQGRGWLEFSAPDDRRFWPSPRAFAALFVAFTIATIPVAAQPSRFAEPPVSIEISAKPITAFDHRDSSRRQFGLLEFRRARPHVAVSGV